MKTIELTCSNCKCIFNRESSKVKKRQKTVYCSRKCASANGMSVPDNNSKPPIFPLSDKWPIELQTRVHGRRKIWCIEYKGGKCEICGYTRHPAALEFHHKDPLKKKFEIGNSKDTLSLKVLQKELDKCAILCANCHREVHAGFIDLNIE